MYGNGERRRRRGKTPGCLPISYSFPTAVRAGGRRARCPRRVRESTRFSARPGSYAAAPATRRLSRKFPSPSLPPPRRPLPRAAAGCRTRGARPGRGSRGAGMRGDRASSERSGGEGSSEVTLWLGNNRTDKLQGTRRSQARVCGRRRRPDVPRGPRGSESTPPPARASEGRF